MLQQTRVDTVTPYFARWMKRFPTIKSLAEAPERAVLRLWEGLGYYARARNLHRAARIVVAQFGGKLPPDRRSLLGLPGIGRYSAGAICSMAFGLDEPTLDGNISRVLARVFNVREVADSSAGKRALWELAAGQLPRGKAGQFNQALMDLGAKVCLPKQPRCGRCPALRVCVAHRLGIQDALPLHRSRRHIPHRHVGAAVIRRRGRVLIAHRSSRGLLGGMWEFPNARLTGGGARAGHTDRGFARGLDDVYGLRVRRRALLMTIRHAYSHFRVTALAFECDGTSVARNPALRWVRISELLAYPMGKIDRQIADRLRE